MRLTTLSVTALCLLLVSCSSTHQVTQSKNANPTQADSQEAPPTNTNPSIAQSPQATIDSIELPDGYHLELVLSEPQIAEPSLAVFDGNGRMYVAEMRTYMQDVDGSGKFERVSRVSMHEDTNEDGNFDRHTIFADNLLLPRIILPLDDRIIIGETNTLDLYSYRDTDGDGVADEKTLWYEGGRRGGNLEHQPSGLIWAQDNWLYTTYNDYRLRFANGELQKEEILPNDGQWGLTQDDFGKVWFVNAGGEFGPIHFQQPIQYGKFSFSGEVSEDFRTVWPIDNIPDTQGGRFQLRDDNSLNHFTATCGQDIFRGDRLPEDLRGDLIFAEPVGRLIRRAKISVQDGITHLENAYPQNEFMRTKDPLFRPVNTVTAPDGTLYIVDMYRGIIQEGNWTKEGSYLRGVILDEKLDKEIGRGRIYRLVHDDFELGPKPNMLNETPAQWVKHLSHPNGWWRDTAQKLIVLKGDQSVIPSLKKLYTTAKDPKVKAHALWTLEGLGAIDESFVQNALQDDEVEIRKAAVRLAEPFIANASDTPKAAAVLNAIESHLKDESPDVVIQAMLSMKRSEVANAKALAKSTAESSKSQGVYAINEQLWKDSDEDPFLLPLLGPAGLKSYRAGKNFYQSLCFTCHGSDGAGTPMGEGKTLAPPFIGSERVLGNPQALIDIVLHGLQGPVDGVDYGTPMISMASYSDEELANVLTYIRNSFGNRSDVVLPEDIAAERVRTAGRTTSYTIAALTEEIPFLQTPAKRFENRASWKLSASHAPELAPLAIDAIKEDGYKTKNTPFVGMWFKIELPEVSSIKSISLDASNHENGFPLSYEVHVSNDGLQWGEAIADGNGEPFTRIHFNEVASAKFIRLTLTEKNGWTPWVIHNLEVYGKE